MRKNYSIISADHIPMVRGIASTVARRCPHYVEYDDLLGEGLLGLVEAQNRFDPSRGVPFGAFARLRVAGAMWDFVRKEVTATQRGFVRSGTVGIDSFPQYANRALPTQHYSYAIRQLLLAATELPLRRREVIADVAFGLSAAETAARYGMSTRRAGHLRRRTLASLEAYQP